MDKETREDIYWTLDTFVMNVKEQLELLELDMTGGAKDEEFLARLENVRWHLIPRFTQDIEEILNDSGRK